MTSNHDIKRGISLYSYQDHFYFRKFTLEDCIATAASTGAEGYEFMPEMMLPTWPHVTPEFLAQWEGWKEIYGIKPSTLCHFADRALHKNKLLTDQELFERSVLYLKMAKQLGCENIRLMHSYHGGKDELSPYDLVNPAIAEMLVPVAEEYGIVMTCECHAPTSIDDPVQQEFLDVAEKMHTDYLKLQIDMSSMEKCPSIAMFGQMQRKGVPESTCDFLREQCLAINEGEKVNWDSVFEECRKRGGFDKVDPMLLDFAFRGHKPPTKPEVVTKMCDKIGYVHAKFHYCDENYVVDNIDYPVYIKALQEGGYKGFINSEFEGNRMLNDMGEVDEVEFVRRQQVLLKNCLGY